MTNKYVLRAKYFAYNDEHYNFYDFSDDGLGKIGAILDDRDAAIKAWKKLEKKTISSRHLSSIQELFERNDEDLRELDWFLFEHSDLHLIYDSDGSGRAWIQEGVENSIAELDEDIIFEFLKKAGILSYSLCEFKSEEQFYIVWLVDSKSYMAYDIYDEGLELRFLENRQQIVQECCANYLRNHGATFKGTLEELSSTPALLRTAIASHENLSYDEEAGELLIENYDPSALALLIPLLAKPPFEIRTVSIDEVCEIQAAILDGSVAGAVA